MKPIFIFIVFTAMFFALSSCSKGSLEDEIIGEWEQISVGHIPDGTTYTWKFAADHNLYRTRKTGSSIAIDTAQWNVEANVASKNTLSIENLDTYTDGKHSIHQLDDYLELQRIEFINGHTDGAFQWNEFEKK